MGEKTLTEEVRSVLKRAGWFPGRDVQHAVKKWIRRLDRPGGFQIFEAARQALTEFGGLRVNVGGPGKTCARLPFVLDPTLAKNEEDRFSDHLDEVREPLYPLGEAGEGYVYIAITPTHRVFLIMDDAYPLGQGIEEAISNMILGVMPYHSGNEE